jgi:hypothetical protein
MKSQPFLRSIASGPHSHLSDVERRKRRDAIRSLRQKRDGDPTRALTVLLSEEEAPHRLTAHFNNRWLRAISRLAARSLDRRLAEGCLPESRLFLAVRAQVLVSPVERTALAHCWADLLTQARLSPVPRTPRVSINRDILLANESAILAILDLLAAPTPGHIRGIAKLSWLLSDGTGPVYNRREAFALAEALRDVTTFLTSSEV